MSKKQKKAIEKKFDKFVDMNTPRERAMRIGKELLTALFPSEEQQKKNDTNKPKEKNNFFKMITKICQQFMNRKGKT